MRIDPININSINYSQERIIELEGEKDKALSIIRLSLEDSPLLLVKDINCPFSLWNKLRELYEAKGFSSNYLISRQLINTT